jgi:hypothetical protein
MKQYLFPFIVLLFLFSSCGPSSTQYDLIIKNTTSKPIHILFKSHHPNDIKSEKIIIPANKQSRVISTADIPNDKIKQPENPCQSIAESIEITLEDGQVSNYKWCYSSDSNTESDFKLTTVDLGQEEYIITIKDSHFD